MRKIFLSFTLMLFAIPGFSQLLKPVKIDSLVTISLPEGYQKRDTIGQQVFTANGQYGFMIVIRAPSPPNNAPLKKERDLNKVLKDYVKGIQGASSGASAENVRDTIIGTLKAKTFTLRTDANGNGDIQFRNFILLYTQDATYTFEYQYPDDRKDLIKAELKSYTSSIKLSAELKRNDQYLSNAKGMPATTIAAIAGGGVLVIVIIIILIVRRKRRLALE